MFTWICPQCGREVPPAYNECPDCAAAAAAGKAPAPVLQPQRTPPPQPQAPEPQAPAPRVAPRTAPPTALPTWVMSVLFALLFITLGGAVYWGLERYKAGRSTAAAPMALENVGEKRANGKQHPLQKFVEVTGIRLLQDARKRAEARFVVVNHSGAEIADLAGNVQLWARTQKSEEEPVGSFAFKLPSLGPFESREMAAPVTTKLRVYELPDWQNVTGEVQLTSP